MAIACHPPHLIAEDKGGRFSKLPIAPLPELPGVPKKLPTKQQKSLLYAAHVAVVWPQKFPETIQLLGQSNRSASAVCQLEHICLNALHADVNRNQSPASTTKWARQLMLAGTKHSVSRIRGRCGRWRRLGPRRNWVWFHRDLTMWQVFIEGGMQGLDGSSIEAICTRQVIARVGSRGDQGRCQQ